MSEHRVHGPMPSYKRAWGLRRVRLQHLSACRMHAGKGAAVRWMETDSPAIQHVDVKQPGSVPRLTEGSAL